MPKFQGKIKIWDIVPKSPLCLKPALRPEPKKILPMADIVVSRVAGKFSENRSFFFFSLGRLLIPRLLPRFLALFLAVLLAATPVLTVMAEELAQEQNQESGIMNQEEILPTPKGSLWDPPLEKEGEERDIDEEGSEEGESQTEEESESEIEPSMTAEDELPAAGEDVEDINEESSEESAEETVQEENQESGIMNQEEIISDDSEPTAEPAESIESEVEPSTTAEDELSEAEKDAEAEEGVNEEDIYEQIRRDLDSEWRSRLEEYRKKAEITEEELRGQKELWNESFKQKLSEEMEKELSQKCVKLEESGYYCLTGEAAKTNLAAGQPMNFNETGGNFPAPKEIFSLKDPEKGNREIYLTENGITRRLTTNDYDDIFPALDISGNLAVWQTLVAGRWQISVYDLTFGKATQLTNSDSNNMNPQIHNNRIVWQAWIDGNWEISLAERKNNNCFFQDDCWNLRRITSNHWHDMFPKIAGDLATWQVFENNVWQLAVYNLKTGSLSSLTRGEERAENPRFAVLWESRQGGQRKYFAYDLSSGELTEIRPGSEESPGPVDLPEIPLTQNVLTVPATSSPTRPDGLADEDSGESEE